MNTTLEESVPYRTGIVSWIVRACALVIVALCAAAIVVQDHSGALPLGLLHARLAAVLSHVCLGISLLALVVLVGEFAMRRRMKVAAVVRRFLAAVIILEVLLGLGDWILMRVAARPDTPYGVYFEERLSDGTRVILKKSVAAGFAEACGEAGSSRADGTRRVLLLGDSYTEGSGRSAECNYPDMVDRALREWWHPDARAIHAGVSGYGPVESLALLKWYVENGCEPDAVVYHLFLENDFTDNLPATERRVVATVISRFPVSRLLRTFHPLNTRIFRWVQVILYRVRATGTALDAIRREKGECNPTVVSIGEPSSFLRGLVEYRLATSEFVAGSELARREATKAIHAMKVEAAKVGATFVLVIFPDRALADPEIVDRMEIAPAQLRPLEEVREIVHASFSGVHVIDVLDALAGRRGMYRTSDTHLSDLGNQVAGRYVGERLAEIMAGR